MIRLQYILFLSLFFTIDQVYSQSKQENMVNEAIGLRGLGKTDEATEILEKCLDKYPDYDLALFVRGNWAVISKKYKEALPYFEKLETVNPSFNPLQKRMIAECYFNQRDFSNASRYIKQFLKNERLSPQNKIYGKRLERNIEFVKNHPKETYTIDYKALGPEVNSQNSEYFPSTNADESALYFTRKTREGEDIWLSYKRNDQWTTAMQIDKPEMENEMRYTSINTYDNDGAHTISPGGRHLFFTSCQRPGGRGSCDLYMVSKQGDKWKIPKLLPTVNSKAWESQPCISADAKRLFFVSSRAGGVGGSDIYMSTLGKGGFSSPVNLGDKVNSDGDEDRPFIHPDGKTLYFSSNGHPGFGGKDLYMSRFENGEWQTPINLGGQINSSSEEISIFINTLGDKAYIAKQGEGKRDFDIFTFDLPEVYKPKPVTYLKGIVTNAKTNEPLKAYVKLSDIAAGKQISTLKTDAKNGDFLMTVTADKEYGFNVIKEGFAIYSENYSFTATKKNSKPEVLEIKLMPLEAGTKFELRNVFFETGKFDLKSESHNELNYIVEILKTSPTLKILVGGHTDNVGSEENNKILSENRAKSVLNYLKENGISEDRLTSKGYGSSKPIDSNDTDEGRAKNRRTEIEIL